VAEAGVAGIAVISAIAKAADPRRAARELAEILRERGGA
jgi:thiamine monophosphate synthase